MGASVLVVSVVAVLVLPLLMIIWVYRLWL